jgi:CheY-like chemotaxis protein
MAVVSPAGNILIVEDDPDTREMLSTLLSIEGFHAVGAEDGLEALHLLRTVKHRAPDVPCLVLLDLKMPRLGGHEFRRAQLGDPTVASVPVAVLSGAVDIEQRAQALGAVASVAKPIDVEQLMNIVRRYCA